MSANSSAAVARAKVKEIGQNDQNDLVSGQMVGYSGSVETEKSEDMAISEFKAKCLGVVEDIASTGIGVTLTKRGLPVARVVPVAAISAPLKGTWAGGGVRITGDLVGFDLTADWEAAQ